MKTSFACRPRPSDRQTLTSEEVLWTRMPPPCETLRPALRYVLQSGGKHLRSKLLRLSARATGRPCTSLEDACALVELLHNGTLLHDDVMDRARVRRGRPSVNHLWGSPMAILAGDFLLAAVMHLALRAGQPRVAHMVVETLRRLVSGQACEISHQGDLTLDEAVCLRIAADKTGALFSLACRLGCLLAGGQDAELEALGRFGRSLGVAFQLSDDAWDYTRAPSRSDKEPGRDLAEGKVTLPVVAALRVASPADCGTIRRILAAPEREEHLPEMIEVLERNAGLSYTRRCARRHLHTALEALSALPPSPERTEIGALARRAVGGDATS